MKEIRLLSIASAFHVVSAYHGICESLKTKGYDVYHLGIDTDNWYARNARQSYQGFGYNVISLPRPSKEIAPWWQTSNISLEANDALDEISQCINKISTEFKPNCFLIADDSGPLEVFLMQLLDSKQVKIVLIEHGLGNVFNHHSNLLVDKSLKNAVHKIHGGLKRLLFKLKKTIFSANSSDEKNSKHAKHERLHQNRLPAVKPFGTNLNCCVCAYSKLTYDLLHKSHKIPSERLFLTGYPYFDQLFRTRELLSQNKSLTNKTKEKAKILFVSTGYGMFGNYNRANEYYKCLVNMIRQIDKQFDIFIRLKPGEKWSFFLANEILEELSILKFSVDDNTIPFQKSVLNYDLVIGEASTTLLESIALWIPVILIKYDINSKKRYKLSWEDIFSELLKVRVLTCYDNIAVEINKSLLQENNDSVQDNFIKNQDVLFYKIDALSSERIGGVIEESLKFINS
jgi:hypothetical protein